ncbi:MAG: GntR family transcriptional regulator [Clostridiales bacterium]|nr:GntR family transcriptional regulator [Clostridiales bacterium]
MNEKGKRSYLPRYQQIAVELATRIASGAYKEGQIIFARSSLASQHGVSPETARRAICILSDLDIVSSIKGSGVTIKSTENAKKYIAQQERRMSIETIRNNIYDCLKRQKADMQTMDSLLTDLVSATEHFRSLNPFVPFQISITADCLYLNQTFSDIRFWQNTGATLIAVQRGNRTIISPGPYIKLCEDDIIFFVTQDSRSDAVKHFLYLKTD